MYICSDSYTVPYSDLSDIRDWLHMGANTQFDPELNKIQKAVTEEIDNTLRREISLPVQTQIAEEIRDIEAEMCAGVYWSRQESTREYGDRTRNDALRRLDKYVMIRFRNSLEGADTV